MSERVKVINGVTVSNTDVKCPGCGATIKYDPTTTKLVCPFCGITKDLPKPEAGAVIEELDRDQESKCQLGHRKETDLLRKLWRPEPLRCFAGIRMLSVLRFDERYACRRE